MRPLFRYGYNCARAGRLWISSRRAGDQENRDNVAANQPMPCPVDDDNEFVAGASRTMEGSQ
jgi:hypothetical protein